MLSRKLWDKKVTEEAIIEACNSRMYSLDNPGFCLLCGHKQDGCEPDAREYECEVCEEHQVYGSEELLMELV